MPIVSIAMNVTVCFILAAQGSRAETANPVAVEGVVIAVERGEGTVSVREPQSIGDKSVRWIVREEKGASRTRLILVEYVHSDDGVTDGLDTGFWRFVLRSTARERSGACAGWRGHRFVKTGQASKGPLPDVNKLQCYVMNERPVLLRQASAARHGSR